jgi:phospholipid/cholesterol/gamma-HCH transport system substrate-binding protein
MRGVKIGLVNQVYLDEDFFAVVDFKVYTHISVPNDSKVNIASDGILGNKYLSITPGGKEQKNVLKNNQEIKKVEDYESIEDQVSKIIFLATQ